MDFSYWIKSVGLNNCDAITKADKPKTTNGLLFLYEAAKHIELKSEMSYEERLVLGFVLPEKKINKSVSTRAFNPKPSKRKRKKRNQPHNALASPQQKSQLNESFRIHRQNIRRLRKEQKLNLKRPRFIRGNMHLNKDCSLVDIGTTHQERLDQLISRLEKYVRNS